MGVCVLISGSDRRLKHKLLSAGELETRELVIDLQISPDTYTAFIKVSTMTLKVTLLVLTLVAQCWCAPQWRNWTPQAILYLKGAQGHRAVLQRTSRDDGDALHVVNHDGNSNKLIISSILLDLLQSAVVEGKSHPESYPDQRDLDWNYF